MNYNINIERVEKVKDVLEEIKTVLEIITLVVALTTIHKNDKDKNR